MRKRILGITLTGALITLGCMVGAVASCRADTKRERSRSDETVRAYLEATMRGDYAAAHALTCTDETGISPVSFESIERSKSLRGFVIESSTTWSSWVDGHGRVYRVRVTYDTGVEVVTIPTHASEQVCVQYRNIRNPLPSPSPARPTAQISGQPT